MDTSTAETTSTATTAATATGATTEAVATGTTTATVASQNFRDYLADDGKFKPGWAKNFGAADTLEAKFTDPKALIGSYASLEKMISAKGIIPPGPNATPADKDAFYKALGRPDKAEDYGVSKAPEKLGDKPFPKELWDQARADGFAKVAHQLGLTKEQAAKLAEFDMQTGMERLGKFNEVQLKAKTDAESELKAEHGDKFPEFLARAERGAAALGLTKEMVANDPALANNPNFIRMAAKVAEMVGEKSAAGARGTQAGNQPDPGTKITEIMNNPKHPWQRDYKTHGHSLAQHNEAVQEMKRLFEQKHGEAA